MLVVLDALPPAERLALVLHDMFAVPFDEVAAVLGRSPAAAKQLASRARRRVQGATVPDSDPARQRGVVDAFLAASRGGDFAALLAVLDPDVVVRADAAAVAVGAAEEVRGAPAVAGASHRHHGGIHRVTAAHVTRENLLLVVIGARLEQRELIEHNHDQSDEASAGHLWPSGRYKA